MKRLVSFGIEFINDVGAGAGRWKADRVSSFTHCGFSKDPSVMLHLCSRRRYFLYVGITDMRRHFDSLSGMVTALMNKNVLSGDIFIFLNKRRNQIKLLQFEGDGFSINHKRLEKGTYELPCGSQEDVSLSLTHQQLLLILEGISLRSVKKRPRYSHA